jgi:plastocyanin
MPLTHTVTIENFAYNPANLSIKVGDSVVWKNKDPHGHTATRDNPPQFDVDVPAGVTSASVTFNQASGNGGFDYYCQPHPFMTGIITVT